METHIKICPYDSDKCIALKLARNMRYLGGKSLMLESICDVIHNNTKDVHVITDIFSGTGIVAQSLKSLGYSVISNDILYFSYVLNKGALELNTPVSEDIRELICHLNNLSIDKCPWFDTDSAFIYQNYSPHDDCARMYFQSANAIKIDLVRQEIERLREHISESHYFYLLSSLIRAVPYVSNITGTYGAYLKYWDKRTYNSLKLEATEIASSNVQCHCYNMDALELAQQIECDLTYLDPPYNSRQYLPNYHILETIAKYDNPIIRGFTGQRNDPNKQSDYCKKSKAKKAFIDLLNALKCRYVLLSYNNEGLLTTDEMSQIIQDSGKAQTFQLLEFDYRRYKNKIPNNKRGLKEQLYFIEREV